MRTLALGLLISVAALGQPGAEKSLLLPHQTHISGTVVDAEGNSIPSAMVAHTDLRTQAIETDENGRFKADTDAPAVVLEKPGYRSLRMRTTEAREARITLERLSQNFPICKDTASRIGLDGMDGGFYFRAVPGIKAVQPNADVDYVARNYWVSVGRKKYFVHQGAGPMWGGSEPRDELVWKSVEFDQRDYEAGRIGVVDAHGTMPDGTRWRHLGMWTASASYENVPPEAAAILDKLLDTACWKPSSTK